jgi:hypothetical protein
VTEQFPVVPGHPTGPTTIDQRLDDLERRGVLVRSGRTRKPFAPVADRPGTLKRFLDERDQGRSPDV